MKIEDIKSFLKQNKITYEKLSELSGISISALKKIFSGQAKYPRVDTVEANCRPFFYVGKSIVLLYHKINDCQDVI